MKQLLLITTFLALMAGGAIAQPAVNGSTPSRNAINVASDANINIGFNQTMDASTLDASTILVFGTYRGKYTGTVSYSGTTAVFNPDEDYLPGEVITVTVTTGAESSGNVAMARAFTFSFTAEADGDGLFKPEVTFSAVPSSQADDVVSADLNGDGYIDLAVLSQGSNSISVHFNNGDETFASPVVLSTANIPMKLIAADVTGSGVSDLVVSNVSANSMSVFANNGDNTFASRVDYGTSGSLPAGDMVVMDLTGDGHLDIVQLHVGSPVSSFLFHYINDGNGGFGTGEQISITDLDSGGSLALSYHSAASSSNSWRPHLLVTDFANEQLRVYENNGSGTSYVFAQTKFAGTNPVAVGGFRLYTNSPGADAVVLNSGSDNITVYTAPEVWSSDSFGEQSNFSVGDSPYALSGGDLDADGDIDLVVANNSGGTISYMRNRFTDSFPSSFLPNEEYNISGNPNTVKLADLNNDGKLDIISANTNGTISILYNYPGPEITSTTPANNATDVDSYDDIQIEFSVDFMDETTMNATTIEVLDDNSDVITSTFDFSGNTLTITPDAPFQQGTSVSVTVTDGVESTTDEAIINPTTFSFDVAESVLEITDVSPAAYEFQHPVSSSVSISFSETVDLSTLDNGVSVYGSVRGEYAGTWSGTTTASFSPSTNFLAGEVITVSVMPAVLSISGAPVESYYEYKFAVNSNSLGSYLAPEEFGTAVGIEDMLVADMTNDGNADVVIYGYDYMAESYYIEVLASDGLGGLVSTETTTFTPYRLRNVLLSDFNNDGNTDAAILDSHVNSGGEGGGEYGEIAGTTGGSETSSVTIILGNGDGTFNTTPVQTSLPADYEIENFVSGDLNGDGNTDLVVTREDGNDAIVLLGQGNGSFSVQTPVSIPNGPFSLMLADVNLDGALDLLTGTLNNSGLAVLEGNGDGTFASPNTTSLSGEPSNIVVQDFNNDGNPDLVAGVNEGQVEVLLNNGFGGFTSAQTFESGWAIEPIDFDGDAYSDLLFNGGSGGVLVYTNNGDGTFDTSPKAFPGSSVRSMKVLDMTGDGSADVIVSNNSSVSIYESVEPVLVSSFTPASNALDVGASTSVTVTFNTNMDDATLDASSIQVTSSIRGKLAGAYSYNAGTQTVTFTPTDNYLAGEIISVNITKDAESAGGVPLESGKFFSFTAESDGYGYFEPEIGMTLSSALSKTLAADMDGDGVTDLIAMSYSDIKVYENDGSGGLTELSSLSISSLSDVWVHDLNQDGLPDVIAKRSSDNNIYFFINDGAGDFTETDYTLVDNFYISIYNGTAAIAFADLNGDGIEDITFASPNFSNARFVLGEGNLDFGNTSYIGSDGGYALEVADLNNDGIPDLIWAGNGDGENGTVHIALGQGGGNFGSVTTRDVGERPEALVVTDLTGNGYPDIATADRYGQSYSVILNTAGSFGQATIYNTSDFTPEAIFSSDVDGDGDQDLLVSGDLETYIAEWDYTAELPKALVAYNDGNGGFGNQIYFGIENEEPNYFEGPQNISILDKDDDGRLDIAGYARGNDSGTTLHRLAYLNNTAAGSSTAPTEAASNPSASDISSSSATLSWTNGDGLRRLVVVKEASAVDATLTDDVGYNANPAFEGGTEIGTGNYVVYGGTGNSATITGLDGETEYYYAIYEINGIPGQEKVLTSGAPTGSFTTAAPPEIWTISEGSTTFTKANFADWTLEANQDRIAYNVWLTREGRDGLFNIYSQSEYDDGNGKVQWAYGTADELESLTFKDFKDAVGDWEGLEYVNGDGPVDLVLFLVESNTYVEVRLEQWTSGSSNGGGFSYTRAAGTVAPPPPPTFDAEAGYALQFDGTDDYFYYDLEDPETEEHDPMPDPVTFEMWVKPGTFTDDKMVIGSSYGTQYRFGIDSTRAFYATFREGAVGDWKRATGTTVLNDNQWYHLAISANSGGEIKVFVNGVLEGSKSTSEVNTSIDRFHFGGMRYPDNGEYHRFNGQMDEVRIWKAERTESEIRSTMFTTASGGDYSNMFATWQMNEGSGTSIVDLVNGNNLDLTLGGASTQPAWVTSDAPIGEGTVEESTDFQTGTTTVGNAALSMGDGFDNPVDVQVTEVTAEPNQFPTGFTSGVGGKYFVINLFGDPGTFSADLTLTYGAGVVTSVQESNPSLLKLYKRSSNSSGAWTEIASATSASAATGVVSWTGITSFSQFIAVAEEYVPPTLDIQITDGSDVISYTDSTYEFSSTFFDLNEDFADSALTISAKSALDGNLYLDQNANGTYDSGTDNQLTANAEFSYTPSGSVKLIYEGAFAGVDTATIKLQSSAGADSVLLDFYTVEATPQLSGNADENGWYLLSNPMDSTVGMLLSTIWTQGATNSNAPSGDATLYRFIQDSAQYVAITTDLDTTKLAAGEGLLAYIFEDDDILDGQEDVDGGWPKTLTNYGIPFGKSSEITVKNVDYDGVSGTSGSEGFALLGNPFGWSLSADSVIATLKREDELANNYVYRWDAVNKTYKIVSSGTINPYEAVFVRLINSGTSATLSFDYNDAIVGPSKKAPEKMFDLNLRHIESGFASTSSIRIGEEGTAQIDPFDGYYLGSFATQYANLYTMIGDQSLTINNLPKDLAGEWEYPVYLDGNLNGEFELNWSGELLPDGWKFILEHISSGKSIDLQEENSHQFNVNSQSLKVAASEMAIPGSSSAKKGEKPKDQVKDKGKSKVNTQSNIEPVFVLRVRSANVVSNENDLGIPTEVELYQNYPNPFNPTSVIRFGVPQTSKVQLEVYDILGRKVMTLLNNETKSPGRYNLQFDARSLSSGMYIYRLAVGNKVMTKKMTLIK